MIAQKVIVEALLNNKIPWRGSNGTPCDIISRQKYVGVDVLLLNLAEQNYGWTSRFWGTHNQWLSQGWYPKPRPKEIPPGKWSQETISGVSLFNLDQIDGGFTNLRKQKNETNYVLAERIIECSGANIQFVSGLNAHYHYNDDLIVFPLREQFINGPGKEPAYYNSLLHELGHWTEPRLKWVANSAECELRAEMIADFLCTELNIPILDISKRNNHKNHIGIWVKLMMNNADLIVRTAKSASEAMDFLLTKVEKTI